MAIGSYHFIVAMVAAWLSREQEAVIDYLKEENKVPREQLGGKPLRLTNAQRRRLARKGKLVGRRGLRELGCIVAPETILCTHSPPSSQDLLSNAELFCDLRDWSPTSLFCASEMHTEAATCTP
ncbi:MAG: hypothetical protein GY811_07870 [Myxococcales bacterium]|nr:hypothetical protein [Myxococcales bacterium]